MAFLVLAYPQLKKSDFDLIQDYRKIHDKLFYSVVDPHVTVVFPVHDFSEKQFVTEIKRAVQGFENFNFSFRCATLNKDSFSDYFHTFLVPDEGYSRIVKLHDRLYAGSLKENHRLDIDFIPHLSIGNSLDKYECKRMVDEWNKNEFEINGTIIELTIVRYEESKVDTVEVIPLK